MVEIEQEELDRLRNIENDYNNLTSAHNKLQEAHNTLKDDYISLCQGRGQSDSNKENDFDKICSEKFDKKKK